MIPPDLHAQPQPPRDQPPDWWPGDDLCPIVAWRNAVVIAGGISGLVAIAISIWMCLA